MDTHPIPLEAVLRAEKAARNVLLQTSRTLQRAGILVAICARTLALLLLLLLLLSHDV